ncbi:type I methionyl aminopeptidase [Bacteriovoracaceae bacterium]|nr:type I methionyl aminopeptidase [Bacteriovoracaceae bacterium]
MITIKSSREIDLMRKTCILAKETLSFAGSLVKAGVTTEEINSKVHDYIIEHGAIPSPLNYHGFPKSICTSLNSVICHGIPSAKELLRNGDILNIDVTTKLNGFHGDTNATFIVGEVPEKVRNLIDVTRLCMEEGIKQVRPGGRLGDIGEAIETLAHKHHYSVVQEYCGHGIGREFHEAPQVLHYGKAGTGELMKEGMIFTIEPMINLGSRHCRLLNDGWTVVTKDNSLSAQFEHTVLVTSDGFEVLT